VIRIGTRGSPLALAQSGQVAQALAEAWPQKRFELVPIRSSGDEPAPVNADKARFVKELDEALCAGEVDLAVHSAKDVPAELAAGTTIVAVPPRADPRDVLCGAAGIDALPDGATVGTASVRRRAQLLAARPTLCIVELRGNVDTRLRHLNTGRLNAIVLAAAGLERLGLSPGGPLPTSISLPAPGQGCLVIQARLDDDGATTIARAIDDRGAQAQLRAERALARALGATCDTPVAAWARPLDGDLVLSAFVGLPDGSRQLRGELRGSSDRPGELGRTLAADLLARGAGELLRAGTGDRECRSAEQAN
jgi:hydroxymethylbilane synthase